MSETAVLLRFLISLRTALSAPTPVVAWGILSITFTVSGPFGTDQQLGIASRFAFWLGIVGAAILLGVIIRVAIQQMRPGTELLTSSLAAALIAGAILAGVFPPFWRWALGTDGSEIPGPAEVAVLVAMLGFGMALLRHFLTRPETPAQDAGAGQSKLLARLPEDSRGEILHLCGSDHYVEVVTSQGSGKVLMRFSDALDEVAQLDGLQVHRSHWVARSAIHSAEEVRGRLFVILVTGKKAPVSRAYRGAVEKLDLIPAR